MGKAQKAILSEAQMTDPNRIHVGRKKKKMRNKMSQVRVHHRYHHISEIDRGKIITC